MSGAIERISVLGGGAWGTALAQTCARAGRGVKLWEHEPGNAAQLETKRESKFLPGVRLDDAIKVTSDLGQAAEADAILLVVPAQAMRAVCTALATLVRDGTPLIACALSLIHILRDLRRQAEMTHRQRLVGNTGLRRASEVIVGAAP